MGGMLAMDHYGIVDAFEFGAPTARNDATFAAALAHIGSAPGTLLLPFYGDGLWTLNSNYTLTGARFALYIPPGVTVGGTGVLNIDCQVFSYTDAWYVGSGGLTGAYRVTLIGAIETQRLGVNTNNPTAPIHILGGTAPAGPAVLKLEDGAGLHTAYTAFFNAGTQYGAIGLAGTTNDVRLALTSGANFAVMGGPMGIGILAPAAPLHIYGPSGAPTGIRIEETTVNGGCVINFVSLGTLRAQLGLVGTQDLALVMTSPTKMVITGGNVGIGTLPTLGILQLGAGTAYMPGGGPWLSSSDRRVKTNISDFTDGLAVALQLEAQWYEYNGLGGMPDDGTRYVGLIAQDVEPVAPYMVGHNDQTKLHPEDAAPTDLLTLNAGALSYILLNAIKEQQTLIEDQQATITSQASQLTALQTALDALTARVTALETP
jgi:Chaperone of endosialidase